MTTDKSKEIVRRFLATVDSRDLDRAAAEHLAADFCARMGGEPMGRDAFKAFGAMFQAGFPDLTHDIDDMIAEGDRVVTRLTVRGTHRGDFQGVPPTERVVAMPAITAYWVAGGVITAMWGVFDSIALLQQIGALPAPAATPA